ncbi:MAG: response regulator [Planctomycetes bacterium]|nr:response regulator [Planctomycetota bacterium]
MTTRKHKSYLSRPLLLLGYGDSAYAAQVSRQFRRHGWEVRQASCGARVRELCPDLAPEVVILDVDLPGESGWLTAAKLRLERPGQRIVLVGDRSTPADESLAHFLGISALLNRNNGVRPLFDEILGQAVAVA